MAGAEADCADIQLLRLVKIRQQQNHAGCWWHSCLGRREGREGKENPSQMCQLTWKSKISYSDAYDRTDAFSWRERSSIFMINSALYYRGSVYSLAGVESWLKTMMQFNATLLNVSLQTNTQVRRHPFRKASDSTSATETCLKLRKEGKNTSKQKKKKNAQISARCVGSSAGHPHTVFASILIFIQYFLKADHWLFSGGKHQRWLGVQLGDAVICCRGFDSRFIMCPDGCSIEIIFPTMINVGYIYFTGISAFTKHFYIWGYHRWIAVMQLGIKYY